MGIKKQPNGKWLADIAPEGRAGKRYRKTFKTKAEAQRWCAWLTTKKVENREWEPKTKRDTRTLTDLISLWWDLHGHHLKAGKDRNRSLLRISDRLGNPLATRITSEMWATYRAERTAPDNPERISANTANHEQAYMRALFNDLTRLGHWDGGNPIATIRQLKVGERELSFLTSDQIIDLLEYLDAGDYFDADIITRICLATGARWGEAENLRAEQISAGKIHFTDTKSGKNRSIPINDCLQRTLSRYDGKHYDGYLFRKSYDAFKKAVALMGLYTPEGQLTHILRHTFASHFMMNGGNILTLQKILGHSTLQMTMRYAHLAPEHLNQIINLNPFH